MHTAGRHVLVELHGCRVSLLDDAEAIEALLARAAQAAGATVVRSVIHRFSPQGVTGVVVLEESHLSVHTWPEAGYAAVDFFTCGDCDPERGVGVIREGLGAQDAELLVVDRGLGPAGRSMRAHRRRLERGHQVRLEAPTDEVLGGRQRSSS